MKSMTNSLINIKLNTMNNTVNNDTINNEMVPTYIHPVVIYGKRFFDIVFSTFALLLLLPVFPLLAIAIKLDTKGPVFYLQQRLGISKNGNNKIFNVIKFRSMGTDAEKDGVAKLAEKADPRITRVGRFLRKTRFDETPQFINVLLGQMSVIGPRPERPELTNDIEKKMPFFRERTYQVLPGLTGLAQVKQSYLGSVHDIDQKLAFDHVYSLSISTPQNWLKMDIAILLQTVLTVLKCNG